MLTRRGKTVSILTAIQVFLAVLLPALPAAGGASRHELQTAMIIKLIDFIQWPETAFSSVDGDRFTIAVLGDNDYIGLLEPFENKMVRNRRLKIIHFPEDSGAASLELKTAQILVVGVSEKNRVTEIITRVAGLPVLTIGDFPEFAEKGGIINFFSKPDNRIGLEINLKSMDRAGIKISSYLLRMARLVTNR